MIGQHTLFKRPTYGWCLGKRETVREGDRRTGRGREGKREKEGK